MKIKIYIEGGGDENDSSFRQGWTAFFEEAGLKNRMPRPVRGKGRERTFDLYQTAVKTRRADELPLLLVDSEELVADGDSEWSHLKKRDCWKKPADAGAGDAFLMVCCMESWFLADREALKIFFGGCWRDGAVPKWAKLEEVPKEKVFQALAKATAACGEKAYAKGKCSFEILKKIDQAKVEQKCPGAKRLLDRLRKA